MNYKVTIRQEAIMELKEASQWYELQRKGLGSEFLLCVKNSFSMIERTPKRFPIVFDNIRRTSIRRFPFTIFYFINDATITILAIFHNRRNPLEWKKIVSSIAYTEAE